MKIILSSNNIWNLYNFRKNLIIELLNNNNEIILIANSDKYKEKIEKLGCKFYKINFKRNSKSIFQLLKIILHYMYLFYKIKPDAYLSFTVKPNILGSIAAFFFNMQVINNITGLGTLFIKNNISTKIIIFLYKISLKKSKKIYFHNIDDLNLFKKYNISNTKNSVVIPGSGVDLNKFKFKEIDFNFPTSFLFVGRLIKDKGINEYIGACNFLKKKYPNFLFKILGSQDKDNMTNLTSSELNNIYNNLNIKYLGYQENPLRSIQESTCVVLPSYREGLSKSLIEACSVGRPIITTDVPGCREIVDIGKNGFLVIPKNIDSLIINMENIISLSKEQVKQYGLYSRNKAITCFDEKLVIDKYLNDLGINV